MTEWRKIPLCYRLRYHSDDGFYDRRLAGVLYPALCNALPRTITDDAKCIMVTRVCFCLYACPSPHSHTTARIRM